MNEMKMVALSLLNYDSAYGQFPFEPARDSGHSADISWRVRVLPFLSENFIYEELDLKKAAGEAPNSQFANQMPQVFGKDGVNSNICAIVSGKLPGAFRDIRDGSSNTVAFIATPNGVPWMKNKDVTADEAVALIMGLPDSETTIVAFYDGSVRKLGNDVPEKTLRALMTPDGMEVIEDF